MKKIILIFTFLLAGCSDYYDKHLVGPYHLLAIDDITSMSIAYNLEYGNKGNQAGSFIADVIPKTIFAVGWNEHYIVAKRHPYNNRNSTDYYYIDIARDIKYYHSHVISNSKTQNPKGVVGPLSVEEFNEKAKELALPAFNYTVKSLE